MISSLERNTYKWFISYKDDDDPKVKPLDIMLLKTSANVKSYDVETKCMYFLVEDDDLLKKLNDI